MPSDEQAKNQSDEMKRRFREALERKKERSRAGEAHLDSDAGVHGTHVPEGKRREFRRKSV